MKGLKTALYILLVPLTIGIGTSCTDTSYPCPGAGRSDAADMSAFNEDGKLKKNKKREARKDEHGIINKDDPGKIEKRRKKYKRKKRKRMTR